MKNNFFLFLMIANILFAQNNYYVNKDGSGNFVKIKEVNNFNFNVGDIVAFKSGQSFSDAILVCQQGVTYTTYGGKIKAIIGDSSKSRFNKTIYVNEEDITLDNLKICGYLDAKKIIEYKKGGLTISNNLIIGSNNSHKVYQLGIDLYSNNIIKKKSLITNNEIRDLYKGIYLRLPFNIEISYNKIYNIYRYDGYYGTGGNCIATQTVSGANDAFDTQYTLHIHHNELFNFEHSAIWIGSLSRVLFEYNDVHSNLDERLFMGGIKSGGLGKIWDNTGHEIGSRGHIIRYNYIHDIKKYGKPGYKYGRATPEQIENRSVIVLDNNTGSDKPIYAEGHKNGSDYSASIGNLMSGQGYGNYWIHNNIIHNVGLRVLSKGRNYYKDDIKLKSEVPFKTKYKSYFINNTLINCGFDNWITNDKGVMLSEWNSQSPDIIVNNIIDFNNPTARMAGRWKESGLFLDYNMYPHQKGTSTKLPQLNDNFASYCQEGSSQNTAKGKNEYYLTVPEWNDTSKQLFIKNIGVNGTYVPDCRIKKNGNLYNLGLNYNLIGDNNIVLNQKHQIGYDPTGRSFSYDIQGIKRNVASLGALSEVQISQHSNNSNSIQVIPASIMGINGKLKKNPYMPLKSPYRLTKYSVNQKDSISFLKENYIDWIKIELRSEIDEISYQKVGILTTDNIIMNPDETNFSFNKIVPGFYYLFVSYKNNSFGMSSKKISISNNKPINYDFTNSQSKAYGDKPMILLPSGKYGFIYGLINADDYINIEDRNIIQKKVEVTKRNPGYYFEDINNDGIVDSIDVNLVHNLIYQKKSYVPKLDTSNKN